jgi:hypothetical protein
LLLIALASPFDTSSVRCREVGEHREFLSTAGSWEVALVVAIYADESSTIRLQPATEGTHTHIYIYIFIHIDEDTYIYITSHTHIYIYS